MKKFSPNALMAVFVLFIAPAWAHASLIFDYSITNTIGTVPGTVTGQIFGLSDNATGAASQVTIETFPTELNSIFATNPIDATLWTTQELNQFTVQSGEIVAGGFRARNTVLSQTQQIFVNDERSGVNYVSLSAVSNRFTVYGDSGLAAANLVPNNTVPEPAPFALLGAGVIAIGVARRKKRKVVE